MVTSPNAADRSQSQVADTSAHNIQSSDVTIDALTARRTAPIIATFARYVNAELDTFLDSATPNPITW